MLTFFILNLSANEYLVKNFTLPQYDIEKKKISKEATSVDFKNDKVSIVNFWAEWCTSCAQEVPLLNKLKKDLVSQKSNYQFNFLGINAGDKPRKIRRFLKKYPFNYTHYVDTTKSYSKSINVESLPVTLVIKNNQILFQGHRPPTLEEVQKLIQKK